MTEGEQSHEIHEYLYRGYIVEVACAEKKKKRENAGAVNELNEAQTQKLLRTANEIEEDVTQSCTILLMKMERGNIAVESI